MEPAALIHANAPHALYGLAGPHLYRFTADFRDGCLILQWVIGEDALEDEVEDYRCVGTDILSLFFDAEIEEPAVPLYANVTAAPVEDPAEIRRLLVDQVTGLVRWRESVAAMAEAGVDHFVEFGGKVLGPMVKRIAPDARTTSVVTMDDIDALVKEL